MQNLINYPDDMQVDLIKDCKQFQGSMALTCYRWLGKTLGVVSDGKFAPTSAAPSSPRRPRGARAWRA